jgi:hypothetical protein
VREYDLLITTPVTEIRSDQKRRYDGCAV